MRDVLFLRSTGTWIMMTLAADRDLLAEAKEQCPVGGWVNIFEHRNALSIGAHWVFTRRYNWGS